MKCKEEAADSGSGINRRGRRKKKRKATRMTERSCNARALRRVLLTNSLFTVRARIGEVVVFFSPSWIHFSLFILFYFS